MNKLKIMKTIHDPNLVFYADLAKHDGGLFMSDDAYGHLCTVTGATWGSHGRYFDGVDDDISAGDVAALRFEYTNSFSLLAWVKPFATNANYAVIAKLAGATTYRGYQVYLDTTAKFRFGVTNNNVGSIQAQVQSTDAVMTTNWQLIGSSYSGTGTAAGMILYYNGRSVAKTTTSDALAGNTILNSVAFRIGIREASDIDYKGDIGEVLVYNRVLTAQEIQNIYLSTRWRYQ